MQEEMIHDSYVELLVESIINNVISLALLEKCSNWLQYNLFLELVLGCSWSKLD